MICLHIDIHNPDGSYGSTDRWWYKNVQDIPNRKQVLEDDFCKHMIQCGYIIGNIYTTASTKSALDYCNEIDCNISDMEWIDVDDEEEVA